MCLSCVVFQVSSLGYVAGVTSCPNRDEHIWGKGGGNLKKHVDRWRFTRCSETVMFTVWVETDKRTPSSKQKRSLAMYGFLEF